MCKLARDATVIWTREVEEKLRSEQISLYIAYRMFVNFSVAIYQGRNMVYGLRAQSPKYGWDQGSEERAQGSDEWDQGSQGF